MQSIPSLPGFAADAVAADVSGDGSLIVGAMSSLTGIPRAFLWSRPTGTLDLKACLQGLGVNLSGWTLDTAEAISRSGRAIVGTGTNPSKKQEAWIVYI